MQLIPTRQSGLEKLTEFAPSAGADYANLRNYDLSEQGHPHVSTLSPYLRHRMISEQEVIEVALQHHTYEIAQKYIQEVYWRTYWKGWLEQRPQVWERHQLGVTAGIDRLQSEAGLRDRFDAACLGQTDLDYFNKWSQDIVKYGYLHNHARMWFASIWIFSLRLPWELGADFFLRHLLDGDPASNTLSWRWIAGLHTQGKSYLARPDNIEKYTQGRFRPDPAQLTTDDTPLDWLDHPTAEMPALSQDFPNTDNLGLLITEEDLNPNFLFPQKLIFAATATLVATSYRSPLGISPVVNGFISTAIQDTDERLPQKSDITATDPAQIISWAASKGITNLATSYVPTGPTRDALKIIENAGISIHHVARDYDRNAWPHATAGYFKFKKKIPELISLFS